MSTSRQAFKLTDAGRMIRAVRDQGLQIKAVTLHRDRVTLEVADTPAPELAEPPAADR